MGRRLNPIEDDGPVGKFAKRLRDRRAQVPKKLTYRAMAAAGYFSHSVLAGAAAGKNFPTWEVTEAFVRACDAEDDEVKAWKNDWLDTHRALGNPRGKLGETEAVVPTRLTSGQPIRAGRLRPVQPDIAEPEQCQPQLDQVRTFDDLCYQLQVLKIAVGNPSLRVLHRRMEQPTKAGIDRYYAGVSTLSEVFSGQRTPRFELLMSIVAALLSLLEDGDASHAYGELWRLTRAWRQAWSRAEFNLVRPDLTRRRRYGNLVLVTQDQDEGPTASVVAAMDTQVAAALLSSLPPQGAAKIISGMLPKKAQAVLKAMLDLTGTVERSAPGVSVTGLDERTEGEAPADDPVAEPKDETG
jgi:hypothetical protein